jgi:hypothetical protein
MADALRPRERLRYGPYLTEEPGLSHPLPPVLGPALSHLPFVSSPSFEGGAEFRSVASCLNRQSTKPQLQVHRESTAYGIDNARAGQL